MTGRVPVLSGQGTVTRRTNVLSCGSFQFCPTLNLSFSKVQSNPLNIKSTTFRIVMTGLVPVIHASTGEI
jgi:hypothetical protein